MMKAVIIQAFGGPDHLKMADRPDPRPASGQVLIDTEAISVGFQDVMIRNGSLKAYGFKEGHIPGGEIAGTVAAVADDVDPSWIGCRVWAFIGLGGGYATQAVAPVQGLVRLPPNLSAARAMALGTAGVVAHFALEHARFRPGETVLVRGASGPLGIMTVQSAARQAAGMIAVTASTAERGERLRALGATHVLDRVGEHPDEAYEYDVIIDVVAGSAVPTFVRKLKPGGRMVVIGAVAGPPGDVTGALFAAFQKSLSFSTFSASLIAEDRRRAMTATLFEAASRGELQTVVDEVFPLHHAARAHEKMEAGGVFGRLVLTPA